MTAPKQPLVERVADEFQQAYPHAFRLRSDAEDAARIAIAACRAEDLKEALERILGWAGPESDNLNGDFGNARALLAELDGQPA